MSSSSNSSSSSSESEGKENFNEESVEFGGIVPYDEDLEPLATEEEAAEHEARMAQEVLVEREYRARLTEKWMSLYGTIRHFSLTSFICLFCRNPYQKLPFCFAYSPF